MNSIKYATSQKYVFDVRSPVVSLGPTNMDILTSSILHDYHKFFKCMLLFNLYKLHHQIHS